MSCSIVQWKQALSTTKQGKTSFFSETRYKNTKYKNSFYHIAIWPSYSPRMRESHVQHPFLWNLISFISQSVLPDCLDFVIIRWLFGGHFSFWTYMSLGTRIFSQAFLFVCLFVSFFSFPFSLKYVFPYKTLDMVNWHLPMHYWFVKVVYRSKI